jgi:hypothetical protein
LEKKLFQEGDLTPAELVGFVTEWYKNHIVRVDTEFGQFFKGKNAGM